MKTPRIFTVGAACLAPIVATCAQAESVRQIGGYFESDARMSLSGREPEWTFMRLDNTARLKAELGAGDVSAHGDFALIYRSFSRAGTLAELEGREATDPFSLESDALYLEIQNLGLERLDLRLGRQILRWGSADRFNPTSVVNPLDLEDPLKFGDRVPNEMAVLSYQAPWSVAGDDITIFDELTFTAVAVPVHRPGQLPASSRLVFEDPSLFVQFVDSPAIDKYAGLLTTFADKGGKIAYDDHVEGPSAKAENLQYGGRISATVLGVDLGAMYFHGYADSLQIQDVSGTFGIPGVQVDLDNPDSLAGLQAALDALDDLSSLPPQQVALVMGYPEVDVLGGDLATSLDFLGGLGLWAEVAAYQHDQMDLSLNFGSERKERLFDEGHYVKYVIGTDYSFTPWWYINVQFLHGFVDEFGGRNLENYMVAGSDLKFFNDQMTLRLFGIVSLADQSFVLYPNVMNRFWDNTEVGVGAFILHGDEKTKFGRVVTGPSQLFVTARYSY